jgi:hypothetical protein
MPPLSGVQVLTPGSTEAARSYVLPAIECAEKLDTNPTGFVHSDLFTMSSCTGALTLQDVTRDSQFNLSYAGGELLYNRSLPKEKTATPQRYGNFDELQLSEQLSGRRWKWQLGDQGMYLPETPIGFSGFNGLTSYGQGLGSAILADAPVFNSSFQPNQGVYTGYATRFSDMALTQIQYSPTGRTMITASGMAGTLQYTSPGFIDNSYWMFTGGYNHFYGRGDEISLTYDENHYMFSGANPGFVSRGLSFLYGHRINGRFSVQLSVAPTVNEISQAKGGTINRGFLSTFDSLQYRERRWDGSLTFGRVTTGGAGVLPGAVRNMVDGSLGRQLSRTVHGSVNGTFSNVQSLSPGTSSVGNRTYNLGEAGVELSREFGEHLSLYLNYQVMRQTSNTPICAGGSCSSEFNRQIAEIGINWHARPIKID